MDRWGVGEYRVCQGLCIGGRVAGVRERMWVLGSACMAVCGGRV